MAKIEDGRRRKSSLVTQLAASVIGPVPATPQGGNRYPCMTNAKTHKIIATEVVQAAGGKFAVVFTYDDGTGEAATVGKQETAEFYAKTQMGEVVPVGVNPLLLNAKKADQLRRTG